MKAVAIAFGSITLLILIYICCQLEMIITQQKFINGFIHDKNMILNCLEKEMIQCNDLDMCEYSELKVEDRGA